MNGLVKIMDGHPREWENLERPKDLRFKDNYNLGEFQVEVNYGRHHNRIFSTNGFNGRFFKKGSQNKHIYSEFEGLEETYEHPNDLGVAFRNFERDLISVLVKGPTPLDYDEGKIAEITLRVNEQGLEETSNYYESTKNSHGDKVELVKVYKFPKLMHTFGFNRGIMTKTDIFRDEKKFTILTNSGKSIYGKTPNEAEMKLKKHMVEEVNTFGKSPDSYPSDLELAKFGLIEIEKYYQNLQNENAEVSK